MECCAADLFLRTCIATADRMKEAACALYGGGTARVREADMPSLYVDTSGSGRVEIASGQVGRAAIEGSGAGDIRIGASIGAAAVAWSGAGAVRLAKVTGRLHKSVSGSGSVTVAD
jgi:hypothetical protein